jgi:hypothetical protein
MPGLAQMLEVRRRAFDRPLVQGSQLTLYMPDDATQPAVALSKPDRPRVKDLTLREAAIQYLGELPDGEKPVTRLLHYGAGALATDELLDVAQAWGLTVATYRGSEGRALGGAVLLTVLGQRAEADWAARTTTSRAMPRPRTARGCCARSCTSQGAWPRPSSTSWTRPRRCAQAQRCKRSN